MNFSIEVPGEANPLTSQQVYLALQSASSSQMVSIQTGTQQLQTWETQQGYYSTLQAVYLDKTLPTEIRYQAIIQLKNGIDKYWRKTATNAIVPDEKAKIRHHLLEGGLREADTRLALQNSLLVAKVVRIDYPNDWPDIITNLIAILRNANETDQRVLRRGQQILLQVVKELATARLRKSQTSLQAVTSELVFLLEDIYNKKVKFWSDFLAGNGDDEQGAMDAMENSLAALKTFRRLLIVGYEYPSHDKQVQTIWSSSQVFLSQLLSMLTAEPPLLVSPAKDLVAKHVLQLSKLHVEMATVHPTSFALLPNTLDLVRSYWGLISMYGDTYGSATQDFSSKALGQDDHTKSEKPVLEELSLKGLLLLRAGLKMVFDKTYSFKYKSPEAKEEQNQAKEFIKSQLLTNELVSQIANVIVTKFFVFRQVDLAAWEEDEDEWEIREEGGSNTWEFEIRPCAEKLFMDLVVNFKDLLVEPLLSFFQSVAGTDQSSVATKDAVYTAMGLSAPVVNTSFDFNTFLASTLVKDVQQTGNGCKVLRRRVAILIGQWVTIQISAENRPLVYQIFQHLLNKDDLTNDHVVRVTAARQFKAVVDDFGFSAQSFLPYAQNILSLIISLIQEIEPTETKMAILETIRITAVRLDSDVSPFTDQIISILPGLWDASGEEHLLKQAVLTLLSTLVVSMQGQSHRYQGLVIPLIKGAVEPGSEMQVYLLDEALDLWSTILAQSVAPVSRELLELIEYAFPLLEIGSDNLRVVLSIMDSYVLLAPEALLGDAVRLRILAAMANLLGVSKRDLAGLVTIIVERMIRAAEALGGSGGATQIAKDLHECGYLGKIFDGLHDSWSANQTTGPDRRHPKVDDVVRTDYFTILARITMADPSVFVTIMSSFGNVEQVWEWLGTEWFRHFDSMANIERQKLSCLALTRVLELPPPMLNLTLDKLQDYFTMWTQVVEEMISGRDDNGDNLIWLTNEGHEYEAPEDVRKRLESGRDPVHTLHTFQFVKQHLEGLVTAAGGEAAFQNTWMINVDKEVINSFQQLGVVRDMN